MRYSTVLALAGALALAVVLAACDRDSQSTAPKVAPEQAFLEAMVPHHASAIEMAEVAEAEAQTPFVKDLAREIEETQTEEIDRMKRIHTRLFERPLEPDMGAHMVLGLSAREAGMDHMDGARAISGRRPFDRAFVDEMTPHHRGATRMAETVLTQAGDPELRRLAEGVVAAQAREVEEMKRFREREYRGEGGVAAG